MSTRADHYRERAEGYFRLARESHDSWMRRQLEELGFEMLECAEEIEPGKTVWPDAILAARKGRRGTGDQEHG